MRKGNYNAVLGEELRDQYSKIIEGIDSLRNLPDKVNEIAEDLETAKTDIAIIRAVVEAQERDLTTVKRHTGLIPNRSNGRYHQS